MARNFPFVQGRHLLYTSRAPFAVAWADRACRCVPHRIMNSRHERGGVVAMILYGTSPHSPPPTPPHPGLSLPCRCLCAMIHSYAQHSTTQGLRSIKKRKRNILVIKKKRATVYRYTTRTRSSEDPSRVPSARCEGSIKPENQSRALCGRYAFVV